MVKAYRIRRKIPSSDVNKAENDNVICNTYDGKTAMANVTNRTVIFREVSRVPRSKTKIPYSLRVYEDDVEYLRTLPNASEFIRQAIEGARRKQIMLDAKGLPFKFIHEIAEYYIKRTIEDFDDEDYLERHSIFLSSPLYRIAQLTLTCPNAYFPDREPQIPVETLDILIEELPSEEAKAFIQKIRGKIEANFISLTGCYDYFTAPPVVKEPLSEDELEVIGKIYDEAKMLLEQAYRKKFHMSPPPADWHMTIFDARSGKGRLPYKLP